MYLCVDSCCAAVGKNSTDTSSAIAELFVMFLFFYAAVLMFLISQSMSSPVCCSLAALAVQDWVFVHPLIKKTCVTFRKCFHRQEKSDCYLTLKQLLESGWCR